jgi:tRNA-dihydrouridine synthase A
MDMIYNSFIMKPLPQNSSLFSVAPMMDWTDRHCRYFHRLLSPHAVLYTEMVTTGAILYGDKDRHLRFTPQEHPVILQLGGSEPDDLAACAKIAEDFSYDEINLNCGCPSERVQKGAFGACLMREPELVAACVDAMKNATSLPVTVKSRIGIDDVDDEPFLDKFIQTVIRAGCDHFIIHARKAILKGLSPKENRTVPPLRYDIVRRVKEKYPELRITLNGGLTNLDDIKTALTWADAVMIGREAYQNPYFVAELEHTLYGTPLPAREDVLRAMIPYAVQQAETYATPLHSITRHMLGLANGLRGARKFRQILGNGAIARNDVSVIEDAIAAISGLAPA